jgi:hypothetical protein
VYQVFCVLVVVVIHGPVREALGPWYEYDCTAAVDSTQQYGPSRRNSSRLFRVIRGLAEGEATR